MGESLLFSLNSTMPLFFFMVLGCLLHRKNFLTDDFVAMANKFVFNVALPVQLFRDLATMDVRASFDGAYVLFCAAATTASILVIWVLAKLMLKDKHIVGEFVQACYRSSAAILGAAFIQNIYGTSGMSGLMILGSVPLYNIFAVVILTLESPSLSRSAKSGMGEKIKKSLKGIVTNPILLGIAAGFVWSLLRLPMPTMVNKTLSSRAGLTSPLALLAIGAGFKGRAALAYLKPTAVATVTKLILLPAIFLPMAVHFGFTDQKLVALLVMLGSVTSKSESAEDVTTQYMDIEARLDNLTAQRTRLQELQASADNLTDLLQIESSLSDVQYQIESYQSQLNWYSQQVSYCTVNITLAEVETLPTGTSFAARLADAAKNGWSNFTTGAQAVVVFLMGAWPAIVIGAACGVVFYQVRHPRKKRPNPKDAK